MMSEELARDLGKIDGVLALLQMCRSTDDEDLEDERWLRQRRKYLSALLAARRSQKGKKIVSLALWR